MRRVAPAIPHVNSYLRSWENHVRNALALLAVGTVALAACAGDSTGPDDEPIGVPITIQANIAGTTIAAVTVEVTGPGISTPITQNLAVSGDVASGTLTVPTGSNRTFTVTAFDANAVETHRGSTTAAVAEGTNTSVSISLVSLTGEVPVEATIGTYTLLISPVADTIAVGDSLQFSALVTDVNGDTITSPVFVWASRNPIIAEVDSMGQAVAGHAGFTNIIVNHNGLAAAAELTVQ